uniref:Uncharacterized protein n=1 Tax=Sarcophilus harrisii TaxID=9305 RepID=A0A7N4NW44_SARHA
MNMGAEFCLPWRWGLGRWGKPRMERISRCISRRSWLRSLLWMKLECTSLSRVKSARMERSRRKMGVHRTRKLGGPGLSHTTCISPASQSSPGRGEKKATGLAWGSK